METNNIDKLTPFDKLTSSRDLQMMKLFIPYTAPDMQRTLGVYVKFLELQNTIRFFTHFDNSMHTQGFGTHIFEEILPYMPSDFSETFEQIKNMMDMAEMMQGQDMQEMYNSMFSQDISEQEKGAETYERMAEESITE